MEKPNNVIRISTSLDSSFFKYWVIFLGPLCHLSNNEISILSEFLKYRYTLSKSIKDNNALLDENVMSRDSRKRIRESLGMTVSHFQVIMNKLRKKGIIVDNRINPKYIPNIREEKGHFQFVILFDLE